MNIFISTDIEGIAGVCRPEQCKKGNSDYEHARRLMTREASAAVRGAFAAGAESVVVADSHASMQNILSDELDARARLVTGSPRAQGMVGGLSSDFDAMLMVGYHAAAGNAGVLAHTCSGLAFARLEIAGRTLGETELFAGFAAELGVPLALVTGDDRLAEEVSQVFPKAETVVVKEYLSIWSALHSAPQNACDRIEQAVEKKLSQKDFCADNRVHTGPFTVEALMTKQIYADACALIPGVERQSATSIRFTADSYRQTIRYIQSMSLVAKGVDV